MFFFRCPFVRLIFLFRYDVLRDVYEQAMLRESWLDDMMHVLEQEESGDDISTAESTLRRHEAIAHDIQSRVTTVLSQSKDILRVDLAKKITCFQNDHA